MHKEKNWNYKGEMSSSSNVTCLSICKIYTHILDSSLQIQTKNEYWIYEKKTVACMHSWMHNDITKTLLNAKACTKLEVNDQLT